jgi:hypothetical protein
MRSGIAYRLAPLVRHTFATEFGLLPTLTAKQNMLCPSMQKWPAYRRLLPTLQAEDWRFGKGYSHEGKSQTPQRHLVNGMICPAWAEQFMGFPIGWTELKRSAMPSSRRSPNSSAGPS